MNTLIKPNSNPPWININHPFTYDIQIIPLTTYNSSSNIPKNSEHGNG